MQPRLYPNKNSTIVTTAIITSFIKIEIQESVLKKTNQFHQTYSWTDLLNSIILSNNRKQN